MDWSEDMNLKIRKMSELDAFKILFWRILPRMIGIILKVVKNV